MQERRPARGKKKKQRSRSSKKHVCEVFGKNASCHAMLAREEPTEKARTQVFAEDEK